MGSPTSDDDPTRRVGGAPGNWGPPQSRPGPGDGGAQYPGPSSPPPGQGGGHPPPGQGGGYPGPDSPTTRLPQPEEQRGQTAPFPQAGGYLQGSPGGPWPPNGPQGAYGYGGPPGGLPPGGGRSNRGLVIALIVGLVALVVVGVALVIAFTREDGETVSAGPSTATSAAATVEPTAPSPSEASSSAPSAPESGGDRIDELLAVIPPDFPGCAGADPAGDGDVAAVDCGPSTTRPGPTAASFYLYEDTATLDSVFARDAGDTEAMPAGADCSTAQGVTTWNAEGVEGGEIACTIGEKGLLIVWTDREFGIEGMVTGPGSTQDELAELADWWRANSDFQR